MVVAASPVGHRGPRWRRTSGRREAHPPAASTPCRKRRATRASPSSTRSRPAREMTLQGAGCRKISRRGRDPRPRSGARLADSEPTETSPRRCRFVFWTSTTTTTRRSRTGRRHRRPTRARRDGGGRVDRASAKTNRREHGRDRDARAAGVTAESAGEGAIQLVLRGGDDGSAHPEPFGPPKIAAVAAASTTSTIPSRFDRCFRANGASFATFRGAAVRSTIAPGSSTPWLARRRGGGGGRFARRRQNDGRI